MSNIVQVQQSNMSRIEQVLISGDLSRLNESERVSYYKAVCESLGLNPLTKPFDYITLNGKLVLYATKACTEQLRTIKKISLKITDKQVINEVYVVTAEAKNSDGREDSGTGAVSIGGLKGDNLANAMMKAETKAKRRVTLSICGLGMLDESELETIPKVAGTPAASVGLPVMKLEQPTESDGNIVQSVYKIGFGQWKSRTLEQVYRENGKEKIVDYMDYLENSAKKKGQPLGAGAVEFIQMAEEFLGAMENAPLEPEVNGEFEE